MEEIRKKIVLYYDSTVSFLANGLVQTSTKEGFARYFHNTGWLFIGKISSMFASFLVGIYVARYLGPSRYGLLNYALSFVALFSIVSSVGIENILNRELVSSPEKRDALLGSGFFIRIIGAIFSIILICVVLVLTGTDFLTSLLIIISSFSFLFNVFGVIEIYFQSQILSKNTAKAQIFSLIVTSVLKIIFILLHLGLIYFVIAYTLDGIIIACGLIFSYKKNGFQIHQWKINKDIVKMLLKNSWPLILSGAAYTVYLKIDQVMIKNMLGNEAVGIYSAAARISEIWYFIPAIICTSLSPAIIKAREISQDIYDKRLTNLYSLMFYLSISIILPVSLLSGIIIIGLFGPSYTGAISVLKIHIWSGIGIFLSYAVTQFLISENYTKIIFKMTLLGAILNIILNIILLPKLGINGAAIATLISYSFVTFSIVFFRKTRRQSYLMLKSLNLFAVLKIK